MIKHLLANWPLLQQIRTGTDGTGPEAMSEHTRNLKPKFEGAKVARSICPYCGVGCGQLAFHKDGKLISIEGDPESPISRGHLCPKGADSYELVTSAGRGDEGEVSSSAFSRVGVPRSGDRRWTWSPIGSGSHAKTPSSKAKMESSLMQTKAIAHLGGATLDNEENYLIKKLFTAGLGMVCISNQARI